MYPPDDENTERDAGLEDDHKGQTGKPDLADQGGLKYPEYL